MSHYYFVFNDNNGSQNAVRIRDDAYIISFGKDLLQKNEVFGLVSADLVEKSLVEEAVPVSDIIAGME